MLISCYAAPSAFKSVLKYIREAALFPKKSQYLTEKSSCRVRVATRDLNNIGDACKGQYMSSDAGLHTALLSKLPDLLETAKILPSSA